MYSFSMAPHLQRFSMEIIQAQCVQLTTGVNNVCRLQVQPFSVCFDVKNEENKKKTKDLPLHKTKTV